MRESGRARGGIHGRSVADDQKSGVRSQAHCGDKRRTSIPSRPITSQFFCESSEPPAGFAGEHGRRLAVMKAAKNRSIKSNRRKNMHILKHRAKAMPSSLIRSLAILLVAALMAATVSLAGKPGAGAPGPCSGMSSRVNISRRDTPLPCNRTVRPRLAPQEALTSGTPLAWSCDPTGIQTLRMSPTRSPTM